MVTGGMSGGKKSAVKEKTVSGGTESYLKFVSYALTSKFQNLCQTNNSQTKEVLK